MGIPSWLSTPVLQVVHTIVQVVLAALLIVSQGPLLVGILCAIILLLTAYIVALVSAYRRRVPCACFGYSSLQVSGRHFARNGILLAMALLALAGSMGGISWAQSFRHSPSETIGGSILTIAVLVLGLLLSAHSASSAGPVRHSESSQPEPQEIAVTGTLAATATQAHLPYVLPRVMIPTDDGPKPLAALLDGKDLLLISLSDNCHFCADVEARLPEYIQKLNPHVSVVLLIAGERRRAIEYTGARTCYDLSNGLWYTLEMPTPSALLIRSNGIPVGSPRIGFDAIEELVNIAVLGIVKS